MADFFQHLNVLNQNMQGHNVHILNAQDKVLAFTQKLPLWKANCKRELHKSVLSITRSASSPLLTTSTPVIQSHLSHFKQYFPDLNNTHLDFVRNPFAPGVGTHLDLATQEQLIDLTNEGEMKTRFPCLPLSEFWMSVRKDFPLLPERIIK